MDLGFTVRILREGSTFVAHVPELDVSSCGDTEAAARGNIADAVHGFLETAKDQGTLDDILREAGYQFENGRWKEPELASDSRDRAAITGSIRSQTSNGRS